MTWVNNIFNSSQNARDAPQDDSKISDLPGASQYVVDLKHSMSRMEAKTGTRHAEEEEEETRSPYWHVWKFNLT